MQDIIKVVRVITYTGPRDLVEKQLEGSSPDGLVRTVYKHVKMQVQTIARFRVGGDTIEAERERIMGIVKRELLTNCVITEELREAIEAIEREVLNVEGNATALPGGDTPQAY